MSRLARELFGEPEQGTCEYCGEPVIRWPNRPAEYSNGDRDLVWIHSPHNGFRVLKCHGLNTIAKPL